MVDKTVLSSEAEDRELQLRVAALLAQRNAPSLRHLRVEALRGVVTLRGRVSSFYEKQLAHQVVRQVADVWQLVDLIDVRAPGRLAQERPVRGCHWSFAR